MDFTYNETQGMIRDTLARFLADTYDFDTRQKNDRDRCRPRSRHLERTCK